MSYFLHDIRLLTIIFLILYGPRLINFDVMQASNVVFAFFYFSYCAFYIFINKKLSGEILAFTILSFSSMLYFILVTIINNSPDLTGVQLIIKLVLYFIVCRGVIYLYRKEYGLKYDYYLICHIIFATFINAIFVIVNFLSRDFRLISGKYIYLDDGNSHWIESGFRVFDVSMGGGASASFAFFMVFLLGIIKIKDLNLACRLMVMTIGISTIFLGRSGFLMSLSVYVFYQLIGIGIRRMFFLGFIFIISCIAFYYVDLNRKWLLWIFEFYFSYLEGGAFETKSSSAIKDMYFYPHELSTLLFGNGSFGRNVLLEYLPSDVGYIRVIWAGGLIGVFLLYWMVFFDFIYNHSITKLLYNKRSLFSFIFVISILLINAKELYVAPRGGGVLCYLVIFLFCTKRYSYEDRIFNTQYISK